MLDFRGVPFLRLCTIWTSMMSIRTQIPLLSYRTTWLEFWSIKVVFAMAFGTVDGSEIRRSPVEVGSLSHSLQGYIPGRAGFLPSTVPSTPHSHRHKPPERHHHSRCSPATSQQSPSHVRNPSPIQGVFLHRCFLCNPIPWRIPGTDIFTHIWLILMVKCS